MKFHQGTGAVFWQIRKRRKNNEYYNHGQRQCITWFSAELVQSIAIALGLDPTGSTIFAEAPGTLMDMKIWSCWESDKSFKFTKTTQII